MEEEITFILEYEGRENIVSISQWDTVGDLKLKIHQIFGIRQDKQLIEGWKSQPKFDNTILQACADVHGITCLNILEGTVLDNGTVDVQAAVSCSRKLRESLLSSVEFHNVSLQDAINQSCSTAIPQQRVLLLYLHNGTKPFSKTVLKMLAIPKVEEILRKHFFLVGWDVEDNRFHTGLMDTLIERNLYQVPALVRGQFCAILLIQNIDGSITLNTCMTDENISGYDFYKSLERNVVLLMKEKNEAASLVKLETPHSKFK